MKNRIALALAAIFSMFTIAAAAAEVSLSGFGTLGYAKSNQPYNFERFINDNGTVERDSVAGVQADVKLTDSVGATVQGKFAPSLNSDSRWDSTLSWAFLSWRPSNDWLFRLGKQRVPLYLYSESLDVGTTYDFVHLPSEMYSISPTNDYIGGSVSKTWNPSVGEFTLDGYTGSIKSNWRIYQRDNIQFPGSPTQPGANFKPFNLNNTGIALTLLRDDDRYRFSLNKLTVAADPGQFFATYPSLIPATDISQIDSRLAAIPAGFVNGSVYTVLPQAHTDKLDSVVFSFGAEINLPHDFRTIAEYGRRKISGIVSGIDTSGGYFALLKDVGAWTPYVSCAMIKSKSEVVGLYQAINTHPGLSTQIPIPLLVDAVSQINTSQRIVADGLLVFDQNTIALGTSYRITPKQKIKAEWARTHVGVVSSFVDAPSGGNISNQNINVLSFSYNFVF